MNSLAKRDRAGAMMRMEPVGSSLQPWELCAYFIPVRGSRKGESVLAAIRSMDGDEMVVGLDYEAAWGEAIAIRIVAPNGAELRHLRGEVMQVSSSRIDGLYEVTVLLETTVAL